ncbi:multicopper oxidase family protein [Hydrogenophaga sp. IBVHS2]|uniref:multicopper oxidase family protein n=1 Tax=Hydrogenophaga sp. IBVHS2 TaxID=1985170 RepID=UPI002119DB02|nr:multicopper oxidase domain-containing protein [Hydrogenophaga sp. IBVHS2]
MKHASTPPTPQDDSDAPISTGISRRDSLKLGAASAVAAGLSMTPNRQAQAEDVPEGPPTAPWRMPLKVMRPKTPVSSLSPAPTREAAPREAGRAPHQIWGEPPHALYRVVVREGQHSFHPDLPTQTIRGYDGTFPGPCIVSRYDEAALVRFVNQIDPYAVGFGSPEISVHLHNLHCASESDGFAGDYWSTLRHGPGLTRPGNYKDHLFMNYYAGFSTDPAGIGDPREALGTLWFHDHRMDYTEQNVYRGMIGSYLLFDDIDSGDENDPNPQALRLPSGVGTYDQVLMISDVQFDLSGNMVFNPMSENKGHLGNKITVNGSIQPFFRVQRRKYRFRIIDSSVARFYEFYLMNGTSSEDFQYIANDGNLLEAPLTMNRVRLAPGERSDIVIDFSKYPLGTRLVLVNRLAMKDGRGPEGLVAKGTEVLRFDVVANPVTPDNSRVPARLREQPPIDLSQVTRRRYWDFDKNNSMWAVNSQLFDVEKPAARIPKGSTEIWTLQGHGSWFHPIHIHMEEFRILSRNGKPPPPHEQGRKDVVALAPDERVEVLIKFRDFTGKYVMHCHNLSHEDHAMMVRFDVI